MQCERSMFTHVKGRSFRGSVGVWLRSEVNYIAADQPIGGRHWPCQTPHRRIVGMFLALSSGGLWPAGVFLGSEFFMMSSIRFNTGREESLGNSSVAFRLFCQY